MAALAIVGGLSVDAKAVIGMRRRAVAIARCHDAVGVTNALQAPGKLFLSMLVSGRRSDGAGGIPALKSGTESVTADLADR